MKTGFLEDRDRRARWFSSTIAAKGGSVIQAVEKANDGDIPAWANADTNPGRGGPLCARVTAAAASQPFQQLMEPDGVVSCSKWHLAAPVGGCGRHFSQMWGRGAPPHAGAIRLLRALFLGQRQGASILHGHGCQRWSSLGSFLEATAGKCVDHFRGEGPCKRAPAKKAEEPLEAAPMVESAPPAEEAKTGSQRAARCGGKARGETCKAQGKSSR